MNTFSLFRFWPVQALAYLLSSGLLLLACVLIFMPTSEPEMTRLDLISRIGFEWTRSEFWNMHSIHFLIGGPYNPLIHPLPAVAIWTGLAAILCLGWQSIGSTKIDGRILLFIFLTGWLALDIRWQANLLRQHQHSYQRYHNMPSENRFLVQDEILYDLIQKVRQQLPESPCRIMILTGWASSPTNSKYYLLRSHYYLLPHNVASFLKQLPQASWVRSGDYILLVGSLSEVPAKEWRGRLWWGKDFSVAVDLLLLNRSGRLYRVK